MKRILFPTDFSDVATNAFVHALHLADVVEAELILLHTFQLPIIDSQFTPDNYYMIYESLQLAEFDAFKDEIPKLRAIAEKERMEHIKITHRLMDGDLVTTIREAIKEENINFVVMGTAGATGWETFFVGTNTGSVLSAVTVPVLSVPINAKYQKINTIGFTTKFKEKDKKALELVCAVAQKTKAQVKCLYVKTSQSNVKPETIKEWETHFAQYPVQFTILPLEDVQGTILDFVSQKSIDVLAMVTYKRNFFVELFSPSLTRKFSDYSEIPILALQSDTIVE
ncbi:Nucleotide-binding universal stress protein, UspA family [Flavobacterium succinicans]|jgi:nucleotide-binding universal stress UspA family protein|uniref:Nucleotide-binding universal stress protein, UspA family n=1 Tax=Flavobacterium succinicans TaxID=29536 RepID=A0A1I4Y103_9FLAO|nr:universal stress protein [Flavobacterium succinicans]SFN31159.1 Nucleotide-binding universal stress protein, UspA family [Flavobacterium succinicans]